MIGVIGFRTDGRCPYFSCSFTWWIRGWMREDGIAVDTFWVFTETNNELSADESYENISVLNPISQYAPASLTVLFDGELVLMEIDWGHRFLMPQIRKLESSLKPNKSNEGDGISALVLAVQMLLTHCEKRKYIKNIVMITNGTGTFDAEGLDMITSKIKAQGMNLVILGVDFDDEEYGVKEEDKDVAKRENEAVLKKICDDVDGTFGTLAEAVDELGMPRIKKVRPVPSYKGKLTLGDLENYDTAFAIDVERYPRTMVAKPPSASRYVVGTQEEGEGPSRISPSISADPGGAQLQGIRQMRTYMVEDENAVGEKKEIEAEELQKGYMYGRTIVPVSSTDEEVTVLQTESSMQIIGFIAAEKVFRPHHLSPPLNKREEEES
jgi:ATP-dependent DNA helicase 2 subunit 2